MLNIYNISTPFPTDYFSQIFANLRLIKVMFEERYTLDHYINDVDLALTDGHNKVTMKAISKSMTANQQPYPLNPDTGLSQLPTSSTMLWIQNDNNTNKLIYSYKDINNTLQEIELRFMQC